MREVKRLRMLRRDAVETSEANRAERDDMEQKVWFGKRTGEWEGM